MVVRGDCWYLLQLQEHLACQLPEVSGGLKALAGYEPQALTACSAGKPSFHLVVDSQCHPDFRRLLTGCPQYSLPFRKHLGRE